MSDLLADAPDAWQWEATAAHRTLVERDATGARLLREHGPLARLRITARPAWAPEGRIEFSAALAHARLDYDGRTQGGAPLATHSRHGEVEVGARWRPLPVSAWGEPSITFDGLRLRRAIAGTVGVSGLTETSTLWMPGVAWSGPVWPVDPTGASLRLQARWRMSLHHHLRVDYAGLFDASSLSGGRRNELALGATLSAPAGWSLAIEWRRARQAQSEPAAIFRRGAPVGQVLQPHIAIDDVGLTLSKQF